MPTAAAPPPSGCSPATSTSKSGLLRLFFKRLVRGGSLFSPVLSGWTLSTTDNLKLCGRVPPVLRCFCLLGVRSPHHLMGANLPGFGFMYVPRTSRNGTLRPLARPPWCPVMSGGGPSEGAASCHHATRHHVITANTHRWTVETQSALGPCPSMVVQEGKSMMATT